MSDRQLTSNEAKAAIGRCMAVKRPVMIWGPPGIGKSEIIEQITHDMEGTLIDLRLGQMEPTDIRGIPYFDREQGVMNWAPPIELPDEAMSKKYKHIVLFLDEINTAAPSVQAAAYQLILNRRVGKYVLPDNTVIVAAGNRESDKGVTYRMPAPLANRFVHVEMKSDFDSWMEWAVLNGIHKDIIGYLTFSKQDLYSFDNSSSSRAFPTPRSWTFVSELIADDNLPAKTVTDLVTGAVGEGPAIKFIAHRKIAGSLPNPADILSGKVKELKTSEISAMYSLVISMCYELREAVNNKVADKEFIKMCDNFFGFMMDNFETELVIMGARIAFNTYNLPILPTKLKNFSAFHKKYGKYVQPNN